MQEEFTQLKDVAKMILMDRSSASKYIRKLGIAGMKKSKARSGKCLVFSKEQVEKIIESRRGVVTTPKEDAEAAIFQNVGVFYLIKLVPDLAPNRIKLGYASGINNRLASHRTAAPTAELVKTWPCKLTWEQPAIDSVSRVGCKSLSGEAFDCDDVEELIKRCDDFFSIMPTL